MSRTATQMPFDLWIHAADVANIGAIELPHV
jgi:hypothetical protein